MISFKKGDVVYRAYHPKFVGVVREVREIDHYGLSSVEECEVGWQDGSVSWEPQYFLNSLDALIERHRKAIVTHEESLARAWRDCPVEGEGEKR